MNRQMFVNLPVKDLKKTMSFFNHLGFEFNPKYSNENAACLVIAENISAMLLQESFFKTFTKKEICDTKKSLEVLVCITAESRSAVDQMVERAVAAGGASVGETKDHGFMYYRSFEDLDGHTWEIMHMDPNAGN